MPVAARSDISDTTAWFGTTAWSANMNSKILIAVLALLLLVLQYKLWIGAGSIAEVWRFHGAIEAQQLENKGLQDRNQALHAEVRDLKSGTEAIEERARNDLGMIRKDEAFYHIVDE